MNLGLQKTIAIQNFNTSLFKPFIEKYCKIRSREIFLRIILE